MPQAESTVMNSKENSKNSSNASTLPPPMEVQSFQDLTMPYLGPVVWAKLRAFTPKYNDADIQEDVFTFGRSKNLHLVNKKVNEVYKSASKEHFIIKRIGDEAILYDLSTWGTFVNGELVGKDNHRTLHHMCKISIVDNSDIAFTFLRSDEHQNSTDDFGITIAFEKDQNEKSKISNIQTESLQSNHVCENILDEIKEPLVSSISKEKSGKNGSNKKRKTVSNPSESHDEQQPRRAKRVDYSAMAKGNL